MIIKDAEAAARLNSPINLINRLRAAKENTNPKKNNAMNLFGIGQKKTDSTQEKKQEQKQEQKQFEPKAAPSTFNPFEPPVETPKPEETIDTILKNSDQQINLGLAHDKALKLLNNSLDMLTVKLDDMSVSKLPSVIAAVSRTVEGIRKERLEASKNNKDREVHYHFYTPEQKKLTDYQIIDVGSSSASAG